MVGYDAKLNSVRIAAMWVFLGPLIIVLGTLDLVTNGSSRNWLRGN